MPRWRDEIYACPSTIKVERPIEVHGPVLGGVDQDRSLHIRPLGDKISKCLRLNRVAGPKIDCIGAEVNLPFDDAAIGFLFAEDVTERVFRDYCYVVGIKVVAELPGCDQDGVKQLLDLGVASLKLT